MQNHDLPPKEVIKNNNDSNTMVKMVFITLSVLFLTVAVGVGLGLGFLTWQQKNNPTTQLPISTSPSPSASVEPTFSPSPSPVAEIDKSEVKIHVVNATSTAGKAGSFKSKLEDDDFTTVTAGNAKGSYEDEGIFVLMKTEDPALIAAISKALGQEVAFAEGITAEDAKGAYTAVVVINE